MGGEPIDPDVEPAATARYRADLDVIGVIAAGGVIGAEARYGLGRVLPHHASSFAWSTVLINVTGCLLIGVLMVILTELISPPRLARPFLGTGILGGYTTYSTFAVDVDNLVRAGRIAVAMSYLLVTLVAGWLAVYVGMTFTRKVHPVRRSDR